MPFLAAANAWLTSIHPVLPWALLTLGIFLTVYASRKLLPKLWIWFDSVTQKVILLGVVLALGACSTLRSGVPVLSTIDAVGRGVSQVLGWCEERGIDPVAVAAAKQAVVDRDYGTALELAKALVQKSRSAGDPIPEETEVVLRLTEGALAAQAVQEGMRALSTTPAAGAQPPK